MVANGGKWCELMDERLASFIGFLGKLKQGRSIGSNKEAA